jgi:hypothetical protein
LPKNQNPALPWLDFTRTAIFYKPDFAIEIDHELKERQSQELAKTHAKTWLCKPWFMPEKINLAKKPEPNLPKLLLKLWSQFWRPDFAENNLCGKNELCQMKLLAYQNLTENHEANFTHRGLCRDLRKFDTKLFEPKTWADFWETKIWKTTTAKNAKLYRNQKICWKRQPKFARLKTLIWPTR